MNWWLGRAGLPVWYAPEYRLPVTSLETSSGFDSRRAERIVAHLLDQGILHRSNLRSPERLSYADLGLVHGQAYLASLTEPTVLSRIFGCRVDELPVDEVLTSVRMAAGATLAAAREALRRRGPTFNLLGGFHHAAPNHGRGFSAVNDVAVAIAVLRSEGFDGPIAILDLDAHAPDGLAECLENQAGVWLGSLSLSGWEVPVGVDETRLATGIEDVSYLLALRRLLSRAPHAALTFIIAGVDTLERDPLGGACVTLEGLRQRDELVVQWLAARPSTWLAAGGYTKDSWRAITGSILALLGIEQRVTEARADWLARYLGQLGSSMTVDELSGEASSFGDDLLADLLPSRRRHSRVLGYYTREGLEFALHRYGILEHLRRLGYCRFRVDTSHGIDGDTIRLYAHCLGDEHLLAETRLEERELAGRSVLYVHWLELRHPRARSLGNLPGQSMAGLGVVREVGELYALAARRLGLQGFAFAPAFYHTAFLAKERLCFADPERHGRFLALLSCLADLPLERASKAVHSGEVLLDGRPYQWEASPMVLWLESDSNQLEVIEIERSRCHFARRAAPFPS